MKVQDIMTTEVTTCRPDNSLADVAGDMWRRDCGVVPMVNADGRIGGVITDRDICIAVATRGRPADRIAAGELARSPVTTCAPGDAVQTALQLMQTHKVRRLPVVDDGGHLKGVLSLSDLIRAVGQRRGSPSAESVLGVLRTISEPGPAAVEAAAT